MTNRTNMENPLGKAVSYSTHYDPSLLYSIARNDKRVELGLVNKLPFQGEDIWNAYEISWLNELGVPQVGVGEIRFNASSKSIVESKSLKLYLNSFNQIKFESLTEVSNCIRNDLQKVIETDVIVSLSRLSPSLSESPAQDNHPSESATNSHSRIFEFERQMSLVCLDQQQIKITNYKYNDSLLKNESSNLVSERLYSNLLKSNCLITNQPDWATLFIEYEGNKICRESLLRYIVSFRNHNEFHEQCVERIFVDLMKHCQPQKLTVNARYTRRGGLDINPWRSNHLSTMDNFRLVRQ